jgi:hypothetical protein
MLGESPRAQVAERRQKTTQKPTANQAEGQTLAEMQANFPPLPTSTVKATKPTITTKNHDKQTQEPEPKRREHRSEHQEEMEDEEEYDEEDEDRDSDNSDASTGSNVFIMDLNRDENEPNIITRTVTFYLKMRYMEEEPM